MRGLAWLVACVGCDGVFHVDPIAPSDASLGSGVDGPVLPPDAQTVQTFCDTVMPTPQFCLDFDQGKYDPTRFSKLVITNNAAIATTADTSVSFPNEMTATIMSAAAGLSLALGEYDAAQPYAGTFELWVRIPNNGCSQDIAVVAWPSQASAVKVTAGSASLGASFTGTACTPSKSLSTTVTLDLWNHVAFSIAQHQVDVTIGGTNVFSATCNALTAPHFQVGTQVMNASGLCITELDNVIVH